MYSLTFGFILMMILCRWTPVSTGDDDEDDKVHEDDGLEDDCKIMREEICRKGMNKKECKETVRFNCTAACLPGFLSTVADYSKKYVTKTIYLCQTATVSVKSTRSSAIQINPSGDQFSTKITITPSFRLSSTVEVSDDDGSGDAPSGSFSLSMSPSSSMTNGNEKLRSATIITPSFPVSSTAELDDLDEDGSGSFTSSLSFLPTLTSDLIIMSSTISSSNFPASSTIQLDGSQVRSESDDDDDMPSSMVKHGDDYDDMSSSTVKQQPYKIVTSTSRILSSSVKKSEKPVLNSMQSDGDSVSKTMDPVSSTNTITTRLTTSEGNVQLASSVVTETITSRTVSTSVTSSKFSPSARSSVFPTLLLSTVTSKPDKIGTKLSTNNLSPSTLIPAFVNYSTAATTPSFLPSMRSESIFSRLLTSVNETQTSFSSITPTKSSALVFTTSSVPSQEDTLYCGKSDTGAKFEKGVLSWPRTAVGSKANTSCPYNKDKKTVAYRSCLMNTEKRKQYWGDVHKEDCSMLEKNMTMDKLGKMKITKENEGTVAILMNYITSHSKRRDVDLVKEGADLLEKLVDNATNLTKIRNELLSSVSNVMDAPTDVLKAANKEHNSTKKILNNIEKIMNKINLSGGKLRDDLTNLVVEAWDVVNSTDDRTFKGFKTEKDGDARLVSVTLPASLLQRYKSKTRITFVNFYNDKLFPQNAEQKMVNSKIVSASVQGDEVKNLTDPVKIEFTITNKTLAHKCRCVYWDFNANGGNGGWSRNGCDYKVLHDGQRVSCSCSHLTHFGVLVDPILDEDVNDLILEGITFVGCYLSIVGILLTIITLLAFKKYRTGVSGQILLNLCLALLFSLIIFIGGIEQTEEEDTCITIAALLHYFVLVALLLMGAEAFHMFFNIVLDRLWRNFALKCCVAAWVVPSLIVVITVSVNTDDYKNDRYCRVSGKSFYIAFLGPAVSVLLSNVIIFLLVLKSLLSTRVLSNRHKQVIVHFRRVLGVAVVFGITWLFGVLAVGELRLIFQYLFCITNSFQGFMIFILYCLTDRKVRERLVRFLCRLPDQNQNRIIDSTSTQRPTDIEINLSMFEGRVPFERSESWSGTWPMAHGHVRSSLPGAIETLQVYPPVGPSYNSNPSWITQEEAMEEMDVYPSRPRYSTNRPWGIALDNIEPPFDNYDLCPSGSRPVTNVPLTGDIVGDKLVESTMSQYNLQHSGGEMSLRSADGSIIFINNGQIVEVPKYSLADTRNLSSSNNNLENSQTKSLRGDYSSRMPGGSFQKPRMYNRDNGEGLSLYKRKPRHNSATTSMEMSRRKNPNEKSYRKKGVHFSADELAISPESSDRWSEYGWGPRLRTHTLEEVFRETDDTGSRIGHEARRTRSAQPSGHVMADDDVEEEYYNRYRRDLDNDDEMIATQFLKVPDTKESRENMPVARSKEDVLVKKNSKFRQSSESSESETSSNASLRWSEAVRPPNLKSYSQSTFSDLNTDEDLDNKTHFTQF